MQQIKIPYKATVVNCPLKFSALKIEYQTLQVDEKASHLLSIKNHAAKAYICEFFLPHSEVCGIRVTPMVFQLEKGKSVEVNIEYLSKMKRLGFDTLQQLKAEAESDPLNNFELMKQQVLEAEAKEPARAEPEDDKKKKAAERKPAAPAEKKKTKKELEEEEAQRKLEEEERQAREEEERKRKKKQQDGFDHDAALAKLGGRLTEFTVDDFHSQHYTWLIPCYFRPAAEAETSRSAMYIEVSTVSTSKILVANRAQINFGEVAVGFRKVEELQITNAGTEDAHLRLGLLPLLSGFNALKVVPPGKTKVVIIQFEPYNQSEFTSSQGKPSSADPAKQSGAGPGKQPGAGPKKQPGDANESPSEKYEQKLTIQSGQASVTVKLLGKSVKPEVTLTPEDGLLNIGATLPGERIEKSFEVKNVSSFSLDFRLELQKAGLKRTDGQEAFLYLPSQGTLAAGQSQTIKVLFIPDRISEKYFHLLKIEVPNQKTERKLFIKAACFPRQAFVSYYQPMEFPPKNDNTQPIENPLDFVRVKDSSLVIGSENKQVYLEFPKLLGGNTIPKDSPALERKLVIGSCKLGDPKLEKPVNFDLTLLVD